MTLENGQQKMTSGSHLLYRWLQLCSMSIENPLDLYFRKITQAVVWRLGAPKEFIKRMAQVAEWRRGDACRDIIEGKSIRLGEQLYVKMKKSEESHPRCGLLPSTSASLA